MWQRGDVVVVRYASRLSEQGGFSGALPLYVIEHTDQQLVTYLAEGTETAAARAYQGDGYTPT